MSLDEKFFAGATAVVVIGLIWTLVFGAFWQWIAIFPAIAVAYISLKVVKK